MSQTPRDFGHITFPFDAFEMTDPQQAAPVLTLISPWAMIYEEDVTFGENVYTDNVRITPLGGIAVKMVASENLAEGEVVEVTVAGTAKQVRKCTAGEDWPLGVVYAAVSSGADVWIVVSGLAYVLPEAAVTPTLGDHVYVPAGGGTDGRADMQAAVNTVRHWGEIGHCVEGAAQGVKCLCIIHFN